MQYKRIVSASAALLFSLAVIDSSAALGRKDKAVDESQSQAAELESAQELKTGDLVTVSGRVRLVGSDPFGELVISDENGQDWYLDDEGKELLQNYEQRTATISGYLVLEERVLADGRKLKDRYRLTRISLL